MKRGEIWTTETGPVLLIGSDTLHHNHFPITYTIPLVNQKPKNVDYPYTHQLDETLWANIYATRPQPTSELNHQTGTTTAKHLHHINQALTRLLGLQVS